MNYKAVISNQETRFKVLHILRFISDRQMLKLQYWIKTKRSLNLKNPQRYSEKIQWYKLNYRNPKMQVCADKYLVRQYIIDHGLKDILIPIYGVYNHYSDIDFSKLPQKFVMKTTNGSGTNYLCHNKNQLDYSKLALTFEKWLQRDIFAAAREWSYEGLQPKIITEAFLEDNKYSSISDYKFFCFNGKVAYIFVDIDRVDNHRRNVYDADWNFIDVTIDHPNFGDNLLKPEGLKEMKNIASKLANDFPAVRIDLYWVNHQVYFGEMTFYPFSGYINFTPDNFDFTLGKKFILPNN